MQLLKVLATSRLKSLLPLLVLTLIFSFGRAMMALRGAGLPDGSELLLHYTFILFVARWVAVDRRSHRFDAPFEFYAFVFFAWLVVIPYYLYKTRGPRGLIRGLGFWILAAIPSSISQTILLTHRN